MPNSILFVFEGERTEKKITDNLTNYYINENTNVQCAFCSDVYQLYNKLCDDPDLDTFSILKARAQNASTLASYNRSDFAEIYLFFDYDGHAPNANDASILDLVQFFNEETDTGKMYISYPMVEALKHIAPSVDFQHLKVPATLNIGYKGIVSDQGSDDYKDLSSLSEEHWKILIEVHLNKMNYIVYNSFSIPDSLISQLQVFQNQLSKFINSDNTISVLSAFPPFVLDYYGVDRTKTILGKDEEE